MNLLPESYTAYAEKHTSPVSELLYTLERDTHINKLYPQMISGQLQGQFLRFISLLHKPKRILEIGTFTGYSAICLCAGLQEGGSLDTFDKNLELKEMVDKYVSKASLDQVIHRHWGNAMLLIPELEGDFDLVFIDADKINYSNYFDMVIDRVPSGGIILADNVMWSGKVTLKADTVDTQALIDFNAKVQADTRVENLLLPFEDGMMVVRKL